MTFSQHCSAVMLPSATAGMHSRSQASRAFRFMASCSGLTMLRPSLICSAETCSLPERMIFPSRFRLSGLVSSASSCTAMKSHRVLSSPIGMWTHCTASASERARKCCTNRSCCRKRIRKRLFLFRQPLHDVLQQRVAGGARLAAQQDDDEFARFVFRMRDDAEA